MNNFCVTVESVFYSILKLKEFKVLETKDNSILFFNKKCYLFVGNHMGEVYVNLSKDRETVIQPFLWAVINNNLDFTNVLPLEFSAPNIEMRKLVEYSLVTEKTLVSLYCNDLLDGDFSKLTNYEEEFQRKSEEMYDFYKRYA